MSAIEIGGHQAGVYSDGEQCCDPDALQRLIEDGMTPGNYNVALGPIREMANTHKILSGRYVVRKPVCFWSMLGAGISGVHEEQTIFVADDRYHYVRTVSVDDIPAGEDRVVFLAARTEGGLFIPGTMTPEFATGEVDDDGNPIIEPSVPKVFPGTCFDIGKGLVREKIFVKSVNHQDGSIVADFQNTHIASMNHDGVFGVMIRKPMPCVIDINGCKSSLIEKIGCDTLGATEIGTQPVGSTVERAVLVRALNVGIITTIVNTADPQAPIPAAPTLVTPAEESVVTNATANVNPLDFTNVAATWFRASEGLPEQEDVYCSEKSLDGLSFILVFRNVHQPGTIIRRLPPPDNFEVDDLVLGNGGSGSLSDLTVKRIRVTNSARTRTECFGVGSMKSNGDENGVSLWHLQLRGKGDNWDGSGGWADKITVTPYGIGHTDHDELYRGGLRVGTSSAGNNLNHLGYDLVACGYYDGLMLYNTSFTVFGCNWEANKCERAMYARSTYEEYGCVRTEGSCMLLWAPNQGIGNKKITICNFNFEMPAKATEVHGLTGVVFHSEATCDYDFGVGGRFVQYDALDYTPKFQLLSLDDDPRLHAHVTAKSLSVFGARPEDFFVLKSDLRGAVSSIDLEIYEYVDGEGGVTKETYNRESVDILIPDGAEFPVSWDTDPEFEINIARGTTKHVVANGGVGVGDTQPTFDNPIADLNMPTRLTFILQADPDVDMGVPIFGDAYVLSGPITPPPAGTLISVSFDSATIPDGPDDARKIWVQSAPATDPLTIAA